MLRDNRVWMAGGLAVLLMISGLARGDEPQPAETKKKPAQAEPRTETADVPKPLKLVSPERERWLRQHLPVVDDGAIQEILDDARLILYTDREMPPAYQDWSGDLQGVHSPSYNISANDAEPYGNGNREFPWGAPAGTHRTRGVESFRFLWLPLDEAGNVRPIVWFRKRLSDSVRKGYAWRFPVGAVVGEVLMLRGPDGKRYTFEMRVRIREYDNWAVNVFRPFPTADDLARAIRHRRPQWADSPSLARLVRHLEQPIELVSHRLEDRHPGKRVFSQSMGVDELPAIDDDALVIELLTETVFKSALGATWRDGTNGVWTCAPTTKAAFHIVPANYDAGFLEVDRVSCMRCHNTVNQHVRRFEPGRDWYGRIRGSDGIFSFHPFAPEVISYNGYGGPVRLRRELVEAGILVRYDKQKHPHAIYHTISYLKE